MDPTLRPSDDYVVSSGDDPSADVKQPAGSINIDGTSNDTFYDSLKLLCPGLGHEVKKCFRTSCSKLSIDNFVAIYNNIKLINSIAYFAWASWASWSSCTTTCGGYGRRYRSRKCEKTYTYSPSRCVGSSREEESCGTKCCPGLKNIKIY